MSDVKKHIKIFEKLVELRQMVIDLENSREKSTMLTKIDELRHWNTDAHQNAQRVWSKNSWSESGSFVYLGDK